MYEYSVEVRPIPTVTFNLVEFLVPLSSFSSYSFYIVRENFFPTAVQHTSVPVINALADTFRIISSHDFPDRWEDMPEKAHEQLVSGESQSTRVILKLLLQYFKHYESKDLPPGGGPVAILAQQVMPTIFELISTLLEQEEKEKVSSTERTLAIYECLKNYYSFIKYTFVAVPCMREKQTFIDWLAVVDRVLQIKVPNQSEDKMGVLRPEPKDSVARAYWPWYRAKKVAVKIIYRLSVSSLSSIRDKDYTKKDPERIKKRKLLISIFRKHIAPIAVETILQYLSEFAEQKVWLSRKIKLYSILTIQHSSEFSAVWEPLKEYLDSFFSDICFGLLRADSDELELYENDPVDWLNAQSSEAYPFEDPKGATESCMYIMTSNRPEEIMPVMDNLILSFLETYENTDPKQRDHAGKEVILRILKLLNNMWRRRKVNRPYIENILVKHVTPALEFSAYPMLQTQAIFVWQNFCDSSSIKDENKMEALQLVLNCLEDSSPLPVRFAAASSLSGFLTGFPECHETVEPFVVPLIEQLFGMLEEIGTDVVVNSISSIINCFTTTLPRIAKQVTEKLCITFLELVKELQESDEESLDAACEAIVIALCDIMDILTDPEAIGTDDYEETRTMVIENVLPNYWPVLGVIFDEEAAGSLEYFTHGCEMVDMIYDLLSERIPEIPETWELAVRMMAMATDVSGHEYATNLTAPLTILMAYDRTRLQGVDQRTGQDYAVLIKDLVLSASTTVDDYDRLVLSKLLSTTMLYGRGMIDRILPDIIEYYTEVRIEEGKTEDICKACANIFGMCLQYSPALTLDILSKLPQGDCRSDILAALLEDSATLSRAVDIKLVVLGWAEFLRTLGGNGIPSFDGQGAESALLDVVETLLHMLSNEEEALERIAKEKQERKEKEEQGPPDEQGSIDAAEEDDDENTAEDGKFLPHEDEEEVDTDEEAEIERSIENDQEDGILVADYDDMGPPPEDDSTPLDHVNSLVYVEESLQIFLASKIGSHIRTLMTNELKEGLQQLFDEAEQRRNNNIPAGTLDPV